MTKKEKLLQEAKELYKSKEYEKVVDLLDSATLKKFKDPDLYAEKAMALQRLRRKIERDEIVKKLLELDKDHPAGIHYQGVQYREKREYQKAIESYKKVILLDPSFTFSYYALGMVYRILNQNEDAIEIYKKGIKIDPLDIEILNALGVVYRDLKIYDKAIENYNKAKELDPEYIDAYNGLGSTYYNLKEYDIAIKNYDKAIELDPEFSYPYYNLGLLYNEQKDYSNSLKFYTEYLKHEKNASDAIIVKSRIEDLKKIIEGPSYEKVSEIVSEIKELLEYQGDQVTHYTGLSTAKILIFEKESSFRASEGAFLNDTSEGKELFNYLNYKYYKNTDSSISYLFDQKPFIASFVPKENLNDLTLWRMYGKENNEEAKGCALTINRKGLVSAIHTSLNPDSSEKNLISKEEEFQFYRVAYIQKDGAKVVMPKGSEKDKMKLQELSEKEKNLNGLMKSLKSIISKLNKKRNLESTDKLNVIEKLNSIAYLFKSAAYVHEQEIRLIVKGVGFKKHLNYEEESPKVYIELGNITSSIESITIGPKVEKAEEWAAVFNYHLEENKNENEKTPDIHISMLPFK